MSNLHSLDPDDGKAQHDHDWVHVIEGHIGHTRRKSPFQASSLRAPESQGKVKVTSGGMTYSYWENKTGSPVCSFTVSYKVPPDPIADDGQILHFYNGMQHAAKRSRILSSILRWGPPQDGDSPCWMVGSFCAVGKDYSITKFVEVKAGDPLEGEIMLTKQGSTFDYHCSFTNISGTELQVGLEHELTTVCIGLAVNGVKASMDYPVGETIVRKINVKTLPLLTWAAVKSPPPKANTVVVDGALNGQINIHYPAPESTEMALES